MIEQNLNVLFQLVDIAHLKDQDTTMLDLHVQVEAYGHALDQCMPAGIIDHESKNELQHKQSRN